MSDHPKWHEWEGVGLAEPARKILYTVGFTDDITALARTIQESGWVDRRAAVEIAHVQNLRVGWHGYVDGDLVPYECDAQGFVVTGDGRSVDLVMPLTWVVVD